MIWSVRLQISRYYKFLKIKVHKDCTMKGMGHLESTGRADHFIMGVFIHTRSCSADIMIGTVLLPLKTTLSKLKQACALLVL